MIRNRAREIGGRRQVMKQYERICFEKALINVRGKPLAEFICPGHILLDTLIQQKYGYSLHDGAVLIDPTDPTQEERALLHQHIEIEGLFEDAEAKVKSYAIATVAPVHLEQVKERREQLIDKTLAAVRERLTKEINCWDRRAGMGGVMAAMAAGKVVSISARQHLSDWQWRRWQLAVWQSSYDWRNWRRWQSGQPRGAQLYAPTHTVSQN